MKITYLGPSEKVIVHPFGEHRKGETKEYPQSFGEELIATSRKQRFSIPSDDINIPVVDPEVADDVKTSARGWACPEAITATAKTPATEKQSGKTKPGSK